MSTTNDELLQLRAKISALESKIMKADEIEDPSDAFLIHLASMRNELASIMNHLTEMERREIILLEHNFQHAGDV